MAIQPIHDHLPSRWPSFQRHDRAAVCDHRLVGREYPLSNLVCPKSVVTLTAGNRFPCGKPRACACGAVLAPRWLARSSWAGPGDQGCPENPLVKRDRSRSGKEQHDGSDQIAHRRFPTDSVANPHAAVGQVQHEYGHQHVADDADSSSYWLRMAIETFDSFAGSRECRLIETR